MSNFISKLNQIELDARHQIFNEINESSSEDYQQIPVNGDANLTWNSGCIFAKLCRKRVEQYIEDRKQTKINEQGLKHYHSF